MTNLIQFLPLTQKHSYTRNNDKSLFNHSTPQQGIKEVQAQVVWNKLYKRELLDNEFSKRPVQKILSSTAGSIKILSSCHNRYPHVLLGTTTYEYHTSKVNPRYIDRADSYYLCLQTFQRNTVYRGCCLEKLFKMIINVRYHASNTPYRHLAHLTAKD